MKKLFLVLALCTTFGLISEKSFSQVRLEVNIGSQPIWGPVGYDHVEYYYLPEIEAYYFVPKRKFIYMENGRWISRAYLPVRYRDYDMYSCRKIVINEDRPYLRHNMYRVRYAPNHGRYNEQVIRDSRDPRYFEIRNHPEHSKWKEYKRRDRNNHDQNNDWERNDHDNNNRDDRGHDNSNHGNHGNDNH
jgi:hypothetical protein